MRREWIWLLLITLLLAGPSGAQSLGGPTSVERSYHGQLGEGTGLGMLEKWCALPNFSFEAQGGIEGWTMQSCNDCHIGAPWNPTRPSADCTFCHGVAEPTAADVPQVSDCLNCHWKDTSKRGDEFTRVSDVHLAAGFLCQDCHVRVTFRGSDHQFLKGSALDTTEPTLKGTLSCRSCHEDAPHSAAGTRAAARLDRHVERVACETCHTGPRPAVALESRSWLRFTSAGKPVTTKRSLGWMPVYKWYDGTGPGEDGDFHLPILGTVSRRDAPGARIYPFNPVSVTWYVNTPESSFDDVIPVPVVKGADFDGDGEVTLEEMRQVVPGASVKNEDMNFSISHSLPPAAEAFWCRDCHGRLGWVLDWEALGYKGDPRSR